MGVKDDFGNVKNDVESALRTAGMAINDDINSFDCKSEYSRYFKNDYE